ncbi:SagB family peptide dehydrogenase [Streptomyces sp. NPDC017993]|uniref:SagB family peptide dehydrogenase n=1 Tax=Streptomyces sp. NPDC017993 TaxID=3365027 RepID=UPI0037B6F562
MLLGQLVPPHPIELWSLRDDTLLDPDAGPHGAVTLDTRWGEERLTGLSGPVREALRRMCVGPVDLRNVLPDFPADGRPVDDTPLAPETGELLSTLGRWGHVVVRTLAVGSSPLLSVVPLSRRARFTPRPVPHGRPCRLSRFTVLRYAAGGLRMESPLSHHRVELLRPEASLLLARLGGEMDDGAWAQPDGSMLNEDSMAVALSYLVAAGMVVVAEPGGEPDGTARPARFAEDDDPVLRTWSPDDLLLHSRSRMGRSDAGFGAVFAHADAVPAEPVVKTSGGGARIPLFRPDLSEAIHNDPPLTAVLERALPPGPAEVGQLTSHQLGSLLYRAARVRRLRDPGPHAPQGYATSDRPYQSMGDTYALELYLLVGGGTWLAPGAYHYDPLNHALERVEGVPEALAELSVEAQTAAGLTGPPPPLITITARFARSAYQFSSGAYASLMKDVGALQQTLSLVATALGLGSCPLAVGDTETAVRALGLSWSTESSVGEFLLSPRATARSAAYGDG